MTEPLYQFQETAAVQVATGAPAYLGFDPGLGKSRTALEAAKRRNVKRLLVIAPASGRYVWEREAKKWWPEMPFRIIGGIHDIGKFNGGGIVLVTYGFLSQKDSFYAKAIIKGDPFDMTVLDEAAAVKNPGANRTRVILGPMLLKLGYLLPLSGTPAPNHAGELYPILKAIYPKAISHTLMPDRQMLQWEFEDTFCRVVRKRFGGGPEIRTIEGSRNLPELRKRMDGFMLRVKKEDVLAELPPIRWDVVPVQPKLDSLAPLPHVPPDLSDEDLLTWLSGATGEHVMRLRHLLGIAKTDASVEYLDDFMLNLPKDRKVLVFAHHKQVITSLGVGLLSHNPVVITGETDPRTRTQRIDTFLNDDRCRMFIGNIQAAGTGLTLIGPRCKCSDVFFVEATYSPSDNYQAACRVHRIGQQDAVVARLLTAHGTIDDRIQNILARKAADFEQLFDPQGATA